MRLEGRIGASGFSWGHPLDPHLGFGFSEFPRAPALVTCSPMLAGAESYLPPPKHADLADTQE